mgnify:FL=1
MQIYFPTLAQALESENLEDSWLIYYEGIDYGETRRYIYEDGSKRGRLVSIYRDDSGRYERPIHYTR